MEKNLLYSFVLFLLMVVCPNLIHSQDYCETTFTENQFSSIQKTELKYGRASEPTGYVDSINLLMDLYYSTENTQSVQPIMFLLHGGSFITEMGNKSTMEEYARLMVSKGFVVVSVGYRTWSFILGGIPSVNNIVDVVVKSMLDLQTAIDYVVDHSGKGIFPEVDLQHMVIGGGSAGAIIANHRMYIDEKDSLPDFLAVAFENNGGLFESHSDDYAIAYGLNMSGGIFDTAWIDAGEPPLISIHGNKDSVVFYDHGLANGFIELYGSKPIDERLKSQGIESYFYTFEDGRHSDIYDNNPLYRDRLLEVLDTGLMLIQDKLCQATSIRLQPLQANVKLINTLVRQDLVVDNQEGHQMRYEILDLWGRTVQTGVLNYGKQRISFSSSVDGYFAFRVLGQTDQDRNYSRLTYQQLFFHSSQ